MTIQEFLNSKTLSSVEKTDDLIINLVIGELVYGISVDTSLIEAGTVLTRTTNFQIDGNLLNCEGISIDISTTNMLGESLLFQVS
jgi:hypothetical protein